MKSELILLIIIIVFSASIPLLWAQDDCGDAFVSLSVDTVIGDSACFSASAGGWGNLNYFWDFTNDGTFDTTTSDNEICHVYEEPDTYLAKVKVEDEAGCIGVDSGEVVIAPVSHFEIMWEKEYLEGTIDEKIGFGFTENIPNAILYVYRSDSNFVEYLDSLGNRTYTIQLGDSSFLIGISPNGQFLAVIKDTIDLEYTYSDWERVFPLFVMNYLGDTIWQSDSAYKKNYISNDGQVVWSSGSWFNMPWKTAVFNSGSRKELAIDIYTGSPNPTGHLFVQFYFDTIWAIDDTGGVEWKIHMEGLPSSPGLFGKSVHWLFDTIMVITIDFASDEKTLLIKEGGEIIDSLSLWFSYITGKNGRFAYTGENVNQFLFDDSTCVQLYEIPLHDEVSFNLTVLSNGSMVISVIPLKILDTYPLKILFLNNVGNILEISNMGEINFNKYGWLSCQFYNYKFGIIVNNSLKIFNVHE